MITHILDRPSVNGRLLLLALQSLVFLIIRTILPSAEEIALVVLAVGTLAGLLNLRRISFLIAGFSVSVALHVFLYEKVSHLSFSLYQLVQNPIEAMQSVIFSLGDYVAIGAIMEFAASIILFAWFLEWTLGKPFFQKRNALWPALLILLITIPLSLKLSYFYLKPVPGIELRFEGNSVDVPVDGQSLFFVQLESVNGPVMFDSKLKWPAEEKVHEMGGVTLPFFWASTFGTNAGFQSILCGASGSMSFHWIHLQKDKPCLPERFKKAGYETVYYYSYNEGNFYQMDQMVPRVGFQKFNFGKQLMDKSDEFFSWGYDDCRFYDRAIADIKKNGLDKKKKVFAYFSVHMNHVPFETHLKMAHPYSAAKDPIEKYLNSAYEQDYCLAKFLDQVKELRRDDINVAISGDHGYPIKFRRELYDHYMTRFQFIPSGKNKNKFLPGVKADVSPAQDQIQSTILELFGAPRRPASFLWALQGKPKPDDYRKCILIADKSTNSVYSIDGNEALKKFTVLNTIEKLDYESRQLKQTTELDRIAKWHTVKTPQECLDRLGVPKFQ